MAKTKTKTKGIDKVLKRAASVLGAGSMDAGLATSRSKATRFVSKKIVEAQRPTMAALLKASERAEGIKSYTRSAGQNANIWRWMKRDGRNPFKFNRLRGVKLWARGMNKVLAGKRRGRDRAAKNLADYMHETTLKNINSSKGLSANRGRYGEWKRKKGLPPLVLSGALRDGLKPVVVEIK